jgi:ferredoxin
MARYRIEIDRDLCCGDGLCGEEAPRTFGRGDEFGAVVTNPNGDPPEDILEAARNCPLHAITLFDAETGQKVWP